MLLFTTNPLFRPAALHNPRAPALRRLVCSSTAPSDSFSSWQRKARLIFDPSLNSSARQVLLQDLAKTAPDALSDCNCKSAFSGLADVARQVVDVVPDLISEGPKIAVDTLQNLPDVVSRLSDAERPSPPMPSVGEIATELRNVFNRTPEGLFTPKYDVLKSEQTYEIREYPSMIMAVTSMNVEKDGQRVNEVQSASAMANSFNTLAGYLFGKNQASAAMKMTTPVVLSKGMPDQSMSFIIGEYASLDDVPQTLDDSVTLQEEPGAIYAASEFTGYVTEAEARRQYDQLSKQLRKDGLELADADAFKCMIYNGPSTIPSLRRNEMMIELIYSHPEPTTEQSTSTQ